MYKGKIFQENDRQSFYSGRRIRKAVEDEQQHHQESTIPEETHEYEEKQSHEEVRHCDVTARRQVQETRRQPLSHALHAGKQVTDDPKAKLVRSIENKVSAYAQTHLIGVFGMNSDNVVFNALQEVENTTFCCNLIMLPRATLINDEYTMFAASMLKFIETECDRRDSYRTSRLSEPWVRNQLCTYLQEIGPRDYGYGYDFDYDDCFTRLTSLGQMLDRGKKCKELLRFLKEQLGSYDAKFIWNIEIDFGQFSHNLLRNLSEIAGDDLIIIVNSLGSLELEVQHMGAKFGFSGADQIGHLNKYFLFEDVIRAD